MNRRDVGRRRAQQMWEEATPVRVARRRGELSAVLSVRLPRQVLRDLTLMARSHGKGPGTLARELIEQGLAMQGQPSPALIAAVLARFFESTTATQQMRRWVYLSQPPMGFPVGRPIPSPTTVPAAGPAGTLGQH